MSLQDNIKAAQLDLIKELGLEKLNEQQRQEILAQIGEVLQQRLVLRMLEEMPEEKKEEFGKILQDNQEDPKVVEDFLANNIPNMEDVVLEEIGKYKTEAKQFLDQATEKDSDEETKNEN